MEKYFKKTDPKNREKGQPISIDDILKTVMKDIGMSQMHELNTVCNVWQEAVGDIIAAHSRPIGLEKGRLTVEVENMVWKQELEGFQSRTVISKINLKLGKKLIFKISCVLARG